MSIVEGVDNPYLAIIAKRQRNLRKKINKINEVEDKLNSNTPINADQVAILAQKQAIERSLVDLDAIKIQLEEVAKEIATTAASTTTVPINTPIPALAAPTAVVEVKHVETASSSTYKPVKMNTSEKKSCTDELLVVEKHLYKLMKALHVHARYDNHPNASAPMQADVDFFVKSLLGLTSVPDRSINETLKNSMRYAYYYIHPEISEKHEAIRGKSYRQIADLVDGLVDQLENTNSTTSTSSSGSNSDPLFVAFHQEYTEKNKPKGRNNKGKNNRDDRRSKKEQPLQQHQHEHEQSNGAGTVIESNHTATATINIDDTINNTTIDEGTNGATKHRNNRNKKRNSNRSSNDSNDNSNDDAGINPLSNTLPITTAQPTDAAPVTAAAASGDDSGGKGKKRRGRDKSRRKDKGEASEQVAASTSATPPATIPTSVTTSTGQPIDEVTAGMDEVAIKKQRNKRPKQPQQAIDIIHHAPAATPSAPLAPAQTSRPITSNNSNGTTNNKSYDTTNTNTIATTITGTSTDTTTGTTTTTATRRSRSRRSRGNKTSKSDNA